MIVKHTFFQHYQFRNLIIANVWTKGVCMMKEPSGFDPNLNSLDQSPQIEIN
jgi:hypothetical protein